MFSLLQRSFANVSLSPSERSLLKTFWGLVHTAVSMGIVAGMQAVVYGDVRDLKTIAYIGGGVFSKTLIDAVTKYINASSGPIWQPGSLGGNTPQLAPMPPPLPLQPTTTLQGPHSIIPDQATMPLPVSTHWKSS